ncbi:MAG TPA: hypothetical protein VGI39_25400 [Polyangiaceae bacterium]
MKRHKEGFVAEYHRRPTPWRVVEVERIARESERKIRAAEAVAKVPTAPPPPYHPASMLPVPAEAEARDTGEALPRGLRRRLAECTMRLELVMAQLGAGGLSRQEASNVMRVELSALEATSRGAQLPTVVAMLAALRVLSEELSGLAVQLAAEPMQILVLGEEQESRERLAVAIETLGHNVRSMSSLRELSERAILPAPDTFFVSASLRGAAPDSGFGDILKELAHAERARVVVYTTAVGASLNVVARDSGAQSCVRVAPNGAVGPLAAQVAPILDELVW